jgi:superfamily II DNA or RNA helicase
MAKGTLTIRNSFCVLTDFPETVMADIDAVLTYQNDIEVERIMLLKKLSYFKRLQNSTNSKKAAQARQMTGLLKKQVKELIANEFVKWLKGDTFPTGHLSIVQDVLAEIYPKYRIEDLRVIPRKQHAFRLTKEFPPSRYYQLAMHSLGMEVKRGVFESAVGTGKSLVLMRLLFELGVTSLIVVPSKPLLNQLKNSLVEHFGERNVVAVSATNLNSVAKLRKLKKTPIRLINIGSLASLNKKGTIQSLVGDVNAIFVDEIHHAGSKSYTDLLPAVDHIYYRYGFTGTFLRNDSKTLDMWGFLSNRLYCYPAHKAIAEGFLTPVEVIVHTVKGVGKRQYFSEYNANYCGGKPMLDRIHTILKDYVKRGEQVLILVNRKDKAGLVVHEYLNNLGFENTYISGDNDKDEIDDALKAFNNKDINILIGSSVIGEGIDIRSSDHLIMCQGGKSEIAIVQAVGRLVRLFLGKRIGHLHDFRFVGAKYMEKHLEMRKIVYKNNFAPKFIKAS